MASETYTMFWIIDPETLYSRRTLTRQPPPEKVCGGFGGLAATL